MSPTRQWAFTEQSSSFTNTEGASERSSTSASSGVEKQPQRTLYEILGADPSETRAEIKQRYVKLAKRSHPDTKGQSVSSSESDEELDFNEIAAAWRTISDPKQRLRYDRSLQAEQFSQDIQDWAGEFTRQAAPAAAMLGNIVTPFLRKTTAATVASVQAAAQDLTKEESSTGSKRNIGSTFQSAVRAAQRAGMYVDSLELLEKSQTLAERAVQESQAAAAAEQELMEIAERRLTMALHTPGSGLTSAEARIVWEDFNQTVNDTLTTWDRALMKHTIDHEIEKLNKAEVAFVEMQELDSEAQQKYQINVQARLKSQKERASAEKAEKEAELALQKARQRVLDARHDLDDISRALASAEVTAKKVDYEMERRSLDLVKQSEKVRSALRVKEKQVCKVKGLPFDGAATTNDQVSAERLKELKELRRQERLLAQNSARLESKAARLLSRASKLKSRAVALERLQENADKNNKKTP